MPTSREGAQRLVETQLRLAGRKVLLRAPQPPGTPPMETALQPCLLTPRGETAGTAELLVAASTLADIAGLPAELFSITSRVVADEIVWRVLSFTAMQYGDTVIAWRVQLAR